jgi:isoleucyl-tRNA synthetase
MGIDKYGLVREVNGKELEGLVYGHPFGFRKGRVVLADYVSKEEGTGLVHTAPGHGNEDYLTGIKYKLDIVMPVDAKGNFDSTAGQLEGQNVYDANKIIIEKLDKSGFLLFDTSIQHAYPHCWRCKSPVIFRATKQWFINIEHRNLRKQLLDVINKNIAWIPASGRERISGMVELRPDWCLSRQRYWGVPIPALICTRCMYLTQQLQSRKPCVLWTTWYELERCAISAAPILQAGSFPRRCGRLGSTTCTHL